jgi:hypothetical protein
MNSLVKEITKGLLPEEEKKETVAIYAGGFKPPTKGHFEVVKTALDQNPEIDKMIIYVGKKDRDGITQSQSLSVWAIYDNYLPFKVEVIPSTVAPIRDVYDYAKEHPNTEVLWVIGAREENQDDFKDIAARTKSITKYPNLELRTIVTKGNVSGTAARNALEKSPEAFYDYIPEFLSNKEKKEIYSTLKGTINEIGDLSVEPYNWNADLNKTNKDDPYDYYDFTTDDGIKYQVVFLREPIGNDAYINYDMSFVAKGGGDKGFSANALTGGNEPLKVMSTVVDITKSHMEYKGDADFITFEPTKGKTGEESAKDSTRGKLYKLIIKKNFPKAQVTGTDKVTVDVSAYKGEDMFEAVVGDKIVCDNCGWEWKIAEGGDDLYTCHKCWHDNTPKSSLNEEASYSQYIDVKQKIKELTKHMLDKGMNITPLPKVIFKHGDSSNAKEFLGKTAYYDPNSMSIVLYTEGRHPKDIVRSFSHEMIHHIQNLEDRLGNITTTNTQEDDSLNDLEAEANLKGTMTFRNWTDSLQENKTKDPFGLNAYAAELGRLREDEGEYKIYLDMDGVVADFDQRFRDLSGMSPDEFESKYGKNAFWEFIDEGDNKVKFWVGIPPMEGAKELVDYVSQHDYSMLTAPSIKKQSRLGKNLWIRNHTGDVFPSKPHVIFKSAKTKHLVKPSLTKFDILIDDKQSTIDNWNNAGGTGILYLSASQVISQLQKLGL